MVGSLIKQTKWLLYRNILVKARIKKASLQELLWPIYFVLILGSIRISIQPKTLPSIPEFPSVDLAYSAKPKSPFAVAPNTSQVKLVVNSLTTMMGVEAAMFYQTEDDLIDGYVSNSSAFSTAVIFAADDPLTDMNYTIRMAYQSLPWNSDLFTGLDQCRGGGCPANQYLYTGFALLQSSLDYVITSIKYPNSSTPMPHISVQMMGKDQYKGSTTTAQALNAIYLVFAFAPFLAFVLIFIVAEKEKKITEGLKMMGMKDLAHWLSWVLTYLMMMIVTCACCALIAWGMKVFPNSNVFLIFLMFLLYGMSLITAAFMLTPFFDKALSAGAFGGLITLVISLLYLPIALTDQVPIELQWILSFLTPFAMTLAVDRVTLLEAGFGSEGIQFHNMWVGDFPFAACLIMLSVDIVLYQLLAIYFDNVVPGPYGLRKPVHFCLMPSYWKCGNKSNQVKSGAYESDQTASHIPGFNQPINGDREDIEPVPPGVQSRDGIRIRDLVKIFKGTKKGKNVRAVDGISMEIYEGEITCLLGHNGAGKTTLINALTGMLPPTNGGATIYGYDVTDPNDLAQLRTMTGVCPQQDIVFDQLSPREHLKVLAGLKGIPDEDMEAEVEKVLHDIDLHKSAMTPAEKLSGGQKRKLCVGMALIGDPKVLFLDEPSSGMDPYSRRQLWSLLKKTREGRVIVLTTHFMDEADILADRKAIIAKGTLRCYGSSLFLKNRFGIGYHLGMVVEHRDKAEQITEFVKSKVSGAELGRSYGMELTFTLPLEDVSMFAGLFSALEASDDNSSQTKAKAMGIQSYGVSMTTLEEVFLKLGEETEQDDALEGEGDDEDTALLNRHDKTGINEHKAHIDDAKGGHVNPAMSRENLSATVSDGDDASTVPVEVKPGPLDCKQIAQRKLKPGENQISALARVKVTLASRNSKVYIMRIIFPSIFMIIGIALAKYINVDSANEANLQPLTFQPDLYLAQPTEELSNRKTELLYGNSSDEDLTTLLAQFDRLYFQYRADNLSDLLSIYPHSLAVNVTSWTQGFNATALYNDTAQHSLPTILNIIGNAFYGAVSGADENITVASQLLPRVSDTVEFTMGVLFVVFFGMALAGIPPGFAVDLVKEREIKAKTQMRISGLKVKNYWLTTFMIDIAQYCLPAVIGVILILAFRVESFMQAGAMVCVIILLIIYLPTNTIFIYCFSFLFDKSVTCETALPWLVNIGMFLGVGPVIALDLVGLPDVAAAIHIVFCLIFPTYGIFGGLYYIDRIYTRALFTGGTDTIEFEDYFKPDNYILPAYFALLIAMVLYGLLMVALESRSLGSSIFDACRKNETAASMTPNKDTIEDEDDDVKAEREKVDEIDASLVSVPESQPAVVMQNLRKTFEDKTAAQKKKQKGKAKDLQTKVAVRNLSIAIERGEVFGLLGPNGAGKTTSLNIVTADLSADCGKVSIGGTHITSPLSDAFQMMGYCPQMDPLWEDLTTREHLEVYAAIKGVHKKDRKEVAEYFMKALKIYSHADKKAKELSGGTKRKLCFCISMLGEPQIVLLDEPSTGMDPGAKRFLWDTVTSSFVGGKGAILTTHSMEEADAVCSRVGIMTMGQLRCIGSTQHLKDKYGGGYVLEVKLKIDDLRAGEDLAERVRALDELAKRLFSSAQVMEKFNERILYKIPSEDVSSLGSVFDALEKGKITLNVEEYSFSQSTLEQVFIQFAKEQEEQERQDEVSGEENVGFRRNGEEV
ncbi:cholesterol transporter ABCA5-like isoform X2 [Ptychodera flava]|uniref:cholesterol transporter ABCA5-like isoform X2 n=1 Tax=Ptychodera flava TaxID=63121 RepID=UPI00396AB053